MLKPEQIPDEVVEAALEAWKKDTESFHPNAGTIAAAINAWPFGAVCHYTIKNTEGWELVLPLPQEKTDG